jgi:hypothetical protein
MAAVYPTTWPFRRTNLISFTCARRYGNRQSAA